MADTYHCPYCSRNELKGTRGFQAHIRNSHPDKEIPSDFDKYLNKEEKEVINKWQKKNPRQKAKKRLQKLKEKAKR